MAPGAPRRILTRSADQTTAAGEDLGSRLAPGDVVVLTGSLGSGKTVFVGGLARGLGIDPRGVRSPSFTIVTEYGPGRRGIRLVHVDLYRIAHDGEIEDLGLFDYVSQGCVLAVEWGERLPAALVAGSLRVSLEDAGGDDRWLTIGDSSSARAPQPSPSQ